MAFHMVFVIARKYRITVRELPGGSLEITIDLIL